MTVMLQPYSSSSISAKRLATALGIRRLRMDGTSRFRPKQGDKIINWGSRRLHFPPAGERVFTDQLYLNHPSAVGTAANKLKCLRRLRENEVPCVDFTEDVATARGWQRANHAVVCRATLTGHSGQGITFVEPEERLVQWPLYTKYEKKRYEFRVHARKVIEDVGRAYVQVKRRRRGELEVDTKIRHHGTGWVYCGSDEALRILPPGLFARAARLAQHAVAALGLDFGAVDMGYNQHYDRFVVYEINTAPGLEGETTLEFYTNMLRRLVALP